VFLVLQGSAEALIRWDASFDCLLSQ